MKRNSFYFFFLAFFFLYVCVLVGLGWVGRRVQLPTPSLLDFIGRGRWFSWGRHGPVEKQGRNDRCEIITLYVEGNEEKKVGGKERKWEGKWEGKKGRESGRERKKMKGKWEKERKWEGKWEGKKGRESGRERKKMKGKSLKRKGMNKWSKRKRKRKRKE